MLLSMHARGSSEGGSRADSAPPPHAKSVPASGARRRGDDGEADVEVVFRVCDRDDSADAGIFGLHSLLSSSLCCDCGCIGVAGQGE
jgi:hypothetical protein